MEHGVCVRVLGDLTLLPIETRKAIAEVVTFSKNNDKYVIINSLVLKKFPNLATCPYADYIIFLFSPQNLALPVKITILLKCHSFPISRKILSQMFIDCFIS